MAETTPSVLGSSFFSVGEIENRERHLRFERLGEYATWIALGLGLLILQLPFQLDLDRIAIYSLMAAIGGYTIVWYHLIPKKYSGRTKNFISNLITVLLLAVLIHYTNGVRGYTMFLYFLVGLSTAMSMPIIYTFGIILSIVTLIFSESFLAPGNPATNLSLATLHSWALCLVVFYSRLEAGEASVAKKREEEIILEKEKTLSGLKDEFVYIISHELKLPVTAAKGYIEKIVSQYSGSLNSEAQDLLQLINVNSSRLNKLLDDLMDISKIEQGSLQVKLSDVSLGLLISEVLSNLLLDARNKKISLLQEGDLETGVKADPDRLREVLTNLVGNAVKYTLEGGRVVVSVKKESGFAKVSVTDTGVGISAEDQRHLFEEFYRVENEQTRTVKGSGLGLFITKQLVEKMGGQIGVLSESGKGSTFYFTLPRYRW